MSVVTRTHFDRSSGSVTFERIQDVEDIIERNKTLQNEMSGQSEDFRLYASVPNIILEKWLNEEYARGNVGLKLFSHEFDKIVHRKLQDPDWKWLRTSSKGP